MSSPGPDHPHAPPPSLWPVGFAVGVAILLTGVVVGWIVAAIGAAIALVFGFLWVRDANAPTVPQGAAGPEQTRPGAAPAAPAGDGAATEMALPLASDAEVERFPRSRFLEGATLGLGGLIGGVITLPVAGFAVLPTFIGQEEEAVPIGPLDAFPEGEWRVVTFLRDPGEGEVSRRTAFVRFNGLLEEQPSFTILSNSCVHLGCPVQPSGPIDEENRVEETIGDAVVARIPANPAAFACPCHGGAYDTEGNRTAGPPVRALDRYEYAVRDGQLWLLKGYSVGSVRNEGKEAIIEKYDHFKPGIHVDGPQEYLYPVNAPRTGE